MSNHHHRYLGAMERGGGLKTAICACGWQVSTRSPRTSWVGHVADLPDLPPDPTGRNWAIPKHLALPRIF